MDSSARSTICLPINLLISIVVNCVHLDMSLKEDANKKAFEHFAKETQGGATVEVTDVSERYECKYR